MLLCSRSPNAVRVRPSQGDGGIDVFIPGAAGWGKERAVWQIKRYCENLTSTEKRAIKRSFRRVVDTAKREGWRLTEWHLIMPLDLTNQNLGWLDTVIGEVEFPYEIHGLLLCDTLAAQYPKVVDYYLRDGKERLQAATESLTAILARRHSLQLDEPLAPTDVMSDLTSIYRALNETDPFYKYSFEVSDRLPPEQPSPHDDGLVAMYAVRQESVWITFKVYALSLAAVEECPITWRIQLAVPADDDDLHSQVQRFIDYGAPLTMPAGTVSGSIDLPGGLGGELSGASLQVLSAPDPGDLDSDRAELSLAIFAPDSDTVIASTTIERTDLSVGKAGVRSVFTEKAGLFKLEMTIKAGRLRQGQMRLEVVYDLAGSTPVDIVDGLKVLAAWHSPNRLAFGLTYGPPDYGIVATCPTGREKEAARWAPVVQALSELQDHVRVRIKMPAEMTKDQAISIIKAAKLVAGEPVIGTMKGAFEVYHQEPLQIDRVPDTVYEFVAIKEIEFELGDDVIEVGKQALFFLGRYTRIDELESEIEPVPGTKGLSIRYTGDAAVTQVASRPFTGELSAVDAGEIGTDDGAVEN